MLQYEGLPFAPAAESLFAQRTVRMMFRYRLYVVEVYGESVATRLEHHRGNRLDPLHVLIEIEEGEEEAVLLAGSRQLLEFAAELRGRGRNRARERCRRGHGADGRNRARGGAFRGR